MPTPGVLLTTQSLVPLSQTPTAAPSTMARSSTPSHTRPSLTSFHVGYAVVTRTWSTPTGMSTPLWAQLNTSTVKAALAHSTEAGASVWGGVIAGGCCKAGPEAIKALREECVKEGLI